VADATWLQTVDFCTYCTANLDRRDYLLSSSPALLFSPKRGALKLQFPHSDYHVVSRLGKAPAILSRIVGTVLVVAFVGYHRRLEGAIPELSNDMPEMKVLTPSPREEK